MVRRSCAQKVVALLVTIGSAVTYVWSGFYGGNGIGNAILIIIQLLWAGIMVICLDEMLQKGHGLGSGIFLFIAINFCENNIWKAFSSSTINRGRGTEFEGAVTALFHLLFTRKNNGLKEAFFRQNLPNVINLLATVVVFIVVIYFQGFRVVLPIRSKSSRGHVGSYPHQAVLHFQHAHCSPASPRHRAVLHFQHTHYSPASPRFQFVLHFTVVNNFVVNLIGKWSLESEYSHSGHLIPVGGLVHHITPPTSLGDMVADPFHPVFYLIFILAVCAYFSKEWIGLSGSSARDHVARQLKEQ